MRKGKYDLSLSLSLCYLFSLGSKNADRKTPVLALLQRELIEHSRGKEIASKFYVKSTKQARIGGKKKDRKSCVKFDSADEIRNRPHADVFALRQNACERHAVLVVLLFFFWRYKTGGKLGETSLAYCRGCGTRRRSRCRSSHYVFR